MGGRFGTVPTEQDRAWSYRSAGLGSVSFTQIRFHRQWGNRYDDIGANYYVYVPVAGHHVSRQRDTRIELVGRGSAAVYLPESGPMESSWDAGSHVLCVTLDRAAVETALHRAVGDDAAEQVAFENTMDTRDGYANSWAELALWANNQSASPDTVLSEPLVGLPLAESLVHGFLLASSPSYTSALAAARTPAPPASIRAAVELIDTKPRDPLTLGGLAAHSGVSVRALQYGFRQYMGMSPMAYLREVRLGHAHQELRASSPSTATVSSVARRWGFGHVGRFSAAHRAKYGQYPVEVLRR